MTVLPDADALETALGEAERRGEVAERRRGLLLALPSFAYMVLFFAVPLVIVLVYSFATRTSSGSTALSDWNLEAYRKLGEPIVRNVVIRSVVLALITTVLCLVIAYPFAYFCATRSATVRNLLLVAVVIPFWTNFLVRNYAWRLLLSSGGPISSFTESIGLGPTEILFTKTAVVIGLVYAYLPFMILPLFASIDRLDWRLVEASRDLYASGPASFRRVVLPLTMPGVIAGSILVFVPSMGAYVTPELLGGGKETLLGSYIVTQFLTARNWPVGASLSFVLMAVMLVSTIIYFRAGGKNL
ncbi:MAG: ABC transporter permease [Actinomycetota bacterium]|nr:ABC transporter permease [Actinomycetota bacterium]MDA2973430.1 ABC transporter permease [Actinomycetota bacterium]MDA3010707.1 ABC transporter permease [Actinomycetota bacterium]